MFDEIRKRSLVRPLLFWITGILLYVFFPNPMLYWGIGIIIVCLFIGLWLFRGRSTGNVSYAPRWVWGFFMFLMTVMLSFEVCHFHDDYLRFETRSDSLFQRIAANWQHTLVQKYDRLSLTEEEKSIVATLTLGYRQCMTKETKQRFSVTGVSHILAVSGFHVAIVCGFLTFIYGFLPKRGHVRWLRCILLIGSVWIFSCITGLSSSAVRAAVMFTLFSFGRCLHRTTDSYNTLAAAAFLMLVYDPSYLFDIGFQLSYIAVFFILFLAPRLQSILEVRNPLLSIPWQWITVTLAAQIGTSALCFYYFGQISSVFLFTNLPITLLATLLMPAALLWLVLPEQFPFFVILQYLVEFLVRAMTQIVERFSEFPMATIRFHFNAWHLLECSVFAFLVMIYLKERQPRLLLLALFVWLIFSIHLLIGFY